jgi:arsenite methyltransferase
MPSKHYREGLAMTSTLRFGTEAARRVEAIYRTSDVAAQRAATLRLLDPRPGERVLDAGSGPGFLARSLAEAVGPEGQVVGLDVSEAFIGIAQARCADLPWAGFELGDVRALRQLEDEAFDAAVCTQVLECIPEVDLALNELLRVLRPGGRLLLVDTDWRGALVWHTVDEARMARVLAAWEPHCANPVLPRTLAPALRRAGFTVEQCQVLTILNPTLHEDTYSHGIIWLIRAFVTKHGFDAAEAEAWEAELHELGRRDEYFFAIGRFVFLARRPA